MTLPISRPEFVETSKQVNQISGQSFNSYLHGKPKFLLKGCVILFGDTSESLPVAQTSRERIVLKIFKTNQIHQILTGILTVAKFSLSLKTNLHATRGCKVTEDGPRQTQSRRGSGRR